MSDVCESKQAIVHGARQGGLRSAPLIQITEASYSALLAGHGRYRSFWEHSGKSLWEADFRDIGGWLNDLRASGVEQLPPYLESHPAAVREALALMRVTDVNPAAVKTFEAADSRELSNHFRETFTDSTHEAFAGELIGLWDEQPHFTSSCTARTLRGNPLDLVVGWYVPVGPRGLELSHAIITVINVTDQLRMKRERQRQETLLRSVLDSTLDPLIIIDIQGCIHSASRSAEMVFGYTPEELVGRNVKMLIPEPNHSAHDGYLTEFRRTGKTHVVGQTRELSARRKDGSVFPCDITIWRVDIPGHAEPFLTGIIRDITERKRAEESLHQWNLTLESRVTKRTAELEETNAELEAFAHTISHDLRAPLRAMHGFAQALLEDFGDRLEGDGGEYASRIVDGARQMDGLIHDLLAYSRIGRSKLMLKPIRLSEVIDEALLRVQHDLKNCTIERPSRTSLPWMIGHRTTLIQIVANLLSNAAKFVSPDRPPRITIGVEEYGNSVRLWVEDNGIGIEPEHCERIFDIFERLHGTEVFPGTGIGLAIVRRAVERMNGQMGLESKFGEGSRFWVDLPAADNHQ